MLRSVPNHLRDPIVTRFVLYRLHRLQTLLASPQAVVLKVVEVIRPILHHLAPLRQVGSAIVGVAERVAHRVDKLMFDEVGTETQHLIEKGTKTCVIKGCAASQVWQTGSRGPQAARNGHSPGEQPSQQNASVARPANLCSQPEAFIFNMQKVPWMPVSVLTFNLNQQYAVELFVYLRGRPVAGMPALA